MAENFGLTWDDIFANPRYQLYWSKIVWPKVPDKKRENAI